jgi:HEAT repeat protein
VTVRSDGALQLAVLEQLAAQAGFEIVAGKTKTQPLTLEIDRVSLVVAIASILDGFSYTVGYEFDKASGNRVLARVEIDKALDSGAHKIRNRVSEAAIRSAEEARGDRREPTSEAYAAEQAELLSELDSPDPEARIDAVDWIDLDGEALERLISLLESDPDAEVRAAIVDRLGEEESPAAMEALINALRDPDSEVVLRAIEILEFEAEAWLIPELERLLAHPDPEVREAAQDAIDFLTE